MSTIKVANIQHPDASSPAITLAGDGSIDIPTLDVGFVQEYNIGDTGPGGGVVFYISPGGFMSGTDGNEVICHYLESWTTDLVVGESPQIQWSETTSGIVKTSLRIGAGAMNTARAVAQNDTPDRAVTLCASFSNNGLSDWFLPSRDELDEMIAMQDIIGNFGVTSYWSSSEASPSNIWMRNFSPSGWNTFSTSKSDNRRVRPIRAF